MGLLVRLENQAFGSMSGGTVSKLEPLRSSSE